MTFDHYLSEVEAKAKECRVAPQYEDDDLGPMFHKCSASACACWRWKGFKTDSEYLTAVKRYSLANNLTPPINSAALDAVNKNRGKHGLPEKPVAGYCGVGNEPKG